jgi:hypothetical protein
MLWLMPTMGDGMGDGMGDALSCVMGDAMEYSKAYAMVNACYGLLNDHSIIHAFHGSCLPCFMPSMALKWFVPSMGDVMVPAIGDAMGDAMIHACYGSPHGACYFQCLPWVLP